MNKVRILVDSCADLSKELYEKYDIDVVAQNVRFGEESSFWTIRFFLRSIQNMRTNFSPSKQRCLLNGYVMFPEIILSAVTGMTQ